VIKEQVIKKYKAKNITISQCIDLMQYEECEEEK